MRSLSTAFVVASISQLFIGSGLSAQQPNGGRLDTLFELPSSANSQSDYVIADMEDLNGDGVPEIVVARAEAEAAGKEEAGTVELLDGATRGLLHQWAGTQEEQEMGVSVEIVTDQDGDGFEDILIGSPGWGNETGRVDLVSSVSFLTIRSWQGQQAGEEFGEKVKLIGDVDGNGSLEIGVGAPNWTGSASFEDGRVFLYTISKSQASGLVRTLEGDVYGSPFRGYGRFGDEIEAIGDLNQDGRADLIVSAPGNEGADYFAAVEGWVYGIEGDTGAQLWDAEGESLRDAFGVEVQAVGDLNSDGASEFLVSAPYAEVFAPWATGFVLLCDGRTGDDITFFLPEQDFTAFGLGLGAADFDLDGKKDFIVAAPGMDRASADNVGCFLVYSGADYSLMYQKWGELPGSYFGIAATHGVDRNGDGFPEIHCWALSASGPGYDPAGYSVSGKRVSQIAANGDEISRSSGGSIQFSFDFPQEAALYWYQLLYSSAGTGPVEIQGLSVPLGYDLNLVNSYLGNYPSAFGTPSGLLNAQGDAAATLQLPANSFPPGLIGSTYYFSVLARAVWGDWEYASVAVPVTFIQ